MSIESLRETQRTIDITPVFQDVWNATGQKLSDISAVNVDVSALQYKTQKQSFNALSGTTDFADGLFVGNANNNVILDAPISKLIVGSQTGINPSISLVNNNNTANVAFTGTEVSLNKPLQVSQIKNGAGDSEIEVGVNIHGLNSVRIGAPQAYMNATVGDAWVASANDVVLNGDGAKGVLVRQGKLEIGENGVSSTSHIRFKNPVADAVLDWDGATLSLSGGDLTVDTLNYTTLNPPVAGGVPNGTCASSYLYWDNTAWVAGGDEVRIGCGAGSENQGDYAVAIGWEAGKFNQGDNAVALGYRAGWQSQHQNTIVINAANTALDTSGTNRLYVNPIRNATTTSALYYNPISKEITYGAGGIPLTGFTATGGDIVRTFIQNGISYTAHIFTTTGALSFTIASFGAANTNPTIDILLVGAGASGGRGDGSSIQGGGGGAGGVVVIYDFPLLNNAVLPQNITTVVGAGGASRTTAGTGNNGNSSYIIVPSALNITDTSLTIDTGSSGGGGGAITAPGSGGNSTYFINSQNNAQFPTQLRFTGGAGGCGCGLSANTTRGNASFNFSGVGGGVCGETITGGAFGSGAGTTAVNQAGCGGGGARGIGSASSSQSRSAGGGGLVTYFDGTRRLVGGGGQGAGLQAGVGNLLGNVYGGGLGQAGATPPTDGIANTGGGGGGSYNLNSGAGGSGLIIIRYRT